MGSKILVMSPLHNMGASTVSAMIAQGFTFSGKTSTLMYTDTNSPLPQWLGIPSVNDPTRSIAQAEKLVRSGSMKKSDILNYTYNYSKNAYLLNTVAQELQDVQRMRIMKHFFRDVPTDIVVMDNSMDITDDATADLIEVADIVFLVTDMSEKCTKRLKDWLTLPVLKNNKHVYIIVNRYDEVIESLRTFAKKLGLPANRVGKLHYNPWITRASRSNSLHDVLPNAVNWDPRVANLNKDIEEYMQCIQGEQLLRAQKGF